jgi:hypothetical protein
VADYTFPPAVVLVESTGDPAIGATGVLRPEAGADPVPVYDLNDSLISNILVGPLGVHQGFKADIPNGLLDFGSVLLPSESMEQRAAGLTAQATADAALAAATAATTAATDAQSTVTDALSTKSNRLLSIKSISANYQLLGSDRDEVLLRTTAATPITITFPSEATESIPVGASGTILVDGLGQVTFQNGSGATVSSLGSVFKSAGQGAMVSWLKTSTNGFHLAGALTAT